ncbi:MAG TPA: alpha/beta hydrolase [Phenylobacterium sp.]|nr:alpha/beta hydrolase [Phenylobacterium sp.]
MPVTEALADGALAPPQPRMIELPARGGAMALHQWGLADRPIDILWSHANGFNAWTYRSLLAPLGERFRVAAIDLRGHGATRLPTDMEGRTSWYGLRDDLLALLEALDQPPMVLAGHSMGGATSLMAAAEAPGRVKALGLFDPVIMSQDVIRRANPSEFAESPLAVGARRRRAVFESREAVLAAYTGRGAFRTWPQEMVADYVAGGFKDTADGQVELACTPAWEASNFTSHQHDTAGAFARTRCPVEVWRAEEGSTCRFEPDADGGRIRLETVPGTTHFLPMERRELVRERLTALAG